VAERNKLIQVPGPGILFSADDAHWACNALTILVEAGKAIPEQVELRDELRDLLWPGWQVHGHLPRDGGGTG
jgi:hypothetical protein